jgi:23S rRNA (cytidine2498-2'-O)-methyltransferase
VARADLRRQKLRVLAELDGLDPGDRITPIVAALQGQARFGDLWVEHPDSDAGKPLAGLARSFGNALRPALRREGLLTDKPQGKSRACTWCSSTATMPSSACPIPATARRGRWAFRACGCRPTPLAFGAQAGRGAADPARRRRTRAADAPGHAGGRPGAAPGGWTWVLTRQHLRVSSVDNGPLRQHVLDTGLVEHLRADGFHWQPPQALDWMVCDMVEQPRRVAERMATWFREGWCRHAIFNLKLPMKKRWDETRLCLDLFRDQAGVPPTLRAKQLYHDREEITVLALGRAGANG